MRLLPLLLVLPGSAFAAEAEQKGMPQLDFANPLTLSQVAWMVGIFLALYVLLARWALPGVSRVLESRAQRIAGDLDTARASKAEADAAMEQARAASRQAHAEAQAAINAAVDAAKQAAAVRSDSLNARLDAQLKQAEAGIQAARASAMASLAGIAMEAAGVMTERLAGRPAAAGRIEREVAAQLAARPG